MKGIATVLGDGRIAKCFAISCAAVALAGGVPVSGDLIALPIVEREEGAETNRDRSSEDLMPDEQKIAEGVYLARPVNRIRLSSNGSVVGEVRYGSRVVKGTASVVTFVHTPQSDFATVAVLPQGLPIATARLTSPFGIRLDPLGGGLRGHSGIDLAAPYGTPVVATADGVISIAGWAGGYGLLVALEHGGGMSTRYGHLSRLAVAPGQSVLRGEIIGYVGSTGRSSGPHLHYETRRFGRAVDPLGN